MPFRFATIYTSNRKSLICALRCFKGRSLHRKSDKTQLKPMWGHSRAHVEWSERRGVKANKMRERERMLFGSFEGKQKAMMRCRWGRASLAHYSSTANHNAESPWFLGTIKERPGECRIYASQFTCVRWELWVSLQRPHHGSPQSSLSTMH